MADAKVLTPMAYAGSRLCRAVNQILSAIDAECDPLPEPIRELSEQLRIAHNRTLFEEAQAAELPDSRYETSRPEGAINGH